MQYLRVGSASLNQTPLDWDGNVERILQVIHKAEQSGVQVLVLPELAISGYGCDDAFFSLETLNHSERCLNKILSSSPNLLLLVGFPLLFGNRLYNAAALVYRAKIVGINIKKILPREGVHYEARWFSPWPSGVVSDIDYCGQKTKIGDISYQAGEIGIGVEICEEAWGAGNVNIPHLYNGLHLVLNPSASHFAFSRYETRKQLVSERSRAMQVFYAYANLVGLEAGSIIYDGSLLIADRGQVVRVGRRFSYEETELICADLDLDLIRSSQMRVRGLSHNDMAKENRGYSIQVPDYHWSPANQAMDIVNLPDEAPLSKEEEFVFSVSLALKDYLRKTGAKGFVVSLSGGSDSGLVSYLVAQMFALGLEHFGSDGLAKHLGLEKPKGDADDYKSWAKEYLTCIYQRTKNNSATTAEAAEALAKALGASFFAADIDSFVDAYVVEGQKILDRELSWSTDDLSLQNIQARARTPLPWLIANVKNALLLNTSNRSEAAVGYCTIDGDSAGGLAPIAGVDKPFVRSFLKWAESKCKIGLGVVPELSLINEQDPTAELRPADQKQTDEQDLMPYEMLEAIEELLIRDKRTLQDVLRVLKSKYPAIDQSQLAIYIKKFDHLFKKNQWKREKLAVSFHLDDESMDPKSWCRYPVISK